MALSRGHKIAIVGFVIIILLMLFWPGTPLYQVPGGKQPIEATLLNQENYEGGGLAPISSSYSTLSIDAGMLKLDAPQYYQNTQSPPTLTTMQYPMLESPDSNRLNYTVSLDLQLNYVGGPYRDSILPLFRVGIFEFVLNTSTSSQPWRLTIWYRETWGQSKPTIVYTARGITSPSVHHFDVVYNTNSGGRLEALYMDGNLVPLLEARYPLTSKLSKTPDAVAIDCAFPYSPQAWTGIKATVPNHTFHYDNIQIWAGVYVAQPLSVAVLWLSSIPWWLWLLLIIFGGYILLKKGKPAIKKRRRKKKKKASSSGWF